MKNKFVLIMLSILTIITMASSAFAAYYYDDGKDKDNPNVDRFEPSSGVKIKESGAARAMEDATRRLMTGEKAPKKTYKKNNQNSNPYKRSYKWF